MNIRVQLAVVRFNTGFRVTGMWIVYASGLMPRALFRVNAWDATGQERNGSWNYNAAYNPDQAIRGTDDITRTPASPTNHQTFLWDGRPGVHPMIEIDANVANAYRDCHILSFYVSPRRGA